MKKIWLIVAVVFIACITFGTAKSNSDGPVGFIVLVLILLGGGYIAKRWWTDDGEYDAYSGDPEYPEVQRGLISGNFTCPTCGASSGFRDQLFPNTACPYCGAPIPEIVELIEQREQMYAEEIRRTQDRADEREARMLQHQRLQAEREYRERQDIRDKKHSQKVLEFVLIVIFIVVMLVISKR